MVLGSRDEACCAWRCTADVDWERGEGLTVLCRPRPVEKLARLVRGGIPFCWLGGLETKVSRLSTPCLVRPTSYGDW